MIFIYNKVIESKSNCQQWMPENHYWLWFLILVRPTHKLALLFSTIKMILKLGPVTANQSYKLPRIFCCGKNHIWLFALWCWVGLFIYFLNITPSMQHEQTQMIHYLHLTSNYLKVSKAVLFGCMISSHSWYCCNFCKYPSNHLWTSNCDRIPQYFPKINKLRISK